MAGVRAPEALDPRKEALVVEPNLSEEPEELHLALPRPKVVPLGLDERLSGPDQAGLYARTPLTRAGYRDTLRVILTLTGGRRRLFASRERLEAATGRSWREVKRHRAALVDAGILEPRGGGTRGKGAAVYWIRTPAEVDEWRDARVRVEAEAGERRCPICGESPPTHIPPRCPSFRRPIQGRLGDG